MLTKHLLHRYAWIAAPLLAALLLAGCAKNEPAVVPTAYTPFSATDKAFTVDSPNGWKSDGGYSSGGVSSGVTFTSGDAKIAVDTDEKGSFLGDALSSPTSVLQGSAPGNAQTPPVDRLHAMTGEKFAADIEGYQEIKTTATRLAYGDTRVTEYTGKGVHGYRVTSLGHDRRMKIVCKCAPEEWDKLNAAFTHVINSVAPGTGG
jgi:hypothetical protein